MKNNRIKIVDFSSLIPGPFATYLLEKHIDAYIVKIEDVRNPDPLSLLRPTKDGIGLAYTAINDKKKIIKKDLREGLKELIISEIKDADIFIENFRLGKTDKMGIGYDDLHKINKHLIYCSISGFDLSSQYANKAAHDLNILALTGYLDTQLKYVKTPQIPPFQIADIITSYNLSLTILSALLNKQQGIHIRISMQEATSEALTVMNSTPALTGKNLDKNDLILCGNLPCYNLYKSKDGKYIAVAALEAVFWKDFCTFLNRQDLINSQFNPSAIDEISKELVKLESEIWMNSNLDFCVTPVLSYNEAKENKYA
jgi:alpha-methylacyl-CoA racemase